MLQKLHSITDKDIIGLAPRKAAVNILFDVLNKHQPFDIMFDKHAQKLDGRDRAFCRQLCLLTLRQRGSLRLVLTGFMSKPLDAKAHNIWFILETAIAQILHMEIKPHAAVAVSVELVKRTKGPQARLSGFVNAVLRRAVREKDQLLNFVNRQPLSNLPDTVRKRWLKDWGDKLCLKFARSLADTPPLDLTILGETEFENWARRLEGEITATGSIRLGAGDVEKLTGYDSGKWCVQDAAAALPVKLLNAGRGENIIDLCAAPGGKTMQLAALGADVTAIDRSEKRLNRLRDNLKRTHLHAEIICDNGLTYRPPTAPDAILLDAPCSATGTFRRNPDGLWTKTSDDINSLVALQASLLDHAASIITPGGRLVYCVCSMEKQEGEHQWQVFLDRHKDMERVTVSPSEIGGLDQFITPEGDVRTYPGPQGNRKTNPDSFDGFFIGRAIKKTVTV